jgi:hypothetical protein
MNFRPFLWPKLGVVHFVSALCVEKVKSHIPEHAISFPPVAIRCRKKACVEKLGESRFMREKQEAVLKAVPSGTETTQHNLIG